MSSKNAKSQLNLAVYWQSNEC